MFRPTTKDELNYAISSCLTNVASGVQCCAASPYCNAGPGTASFTDDIGDWDTSLITDMSSLFDVRQFQRGHQQVEHVAGHKHESMFSGATVFNRPIGTWDTSKVTDMQYPSMIPQVTRMEPSPAFNQPIGSWDTSKVTDMECMFDLRHRVQSTHRLMGYLAGHEHGVHVRNAAAFNQPIGSWDTSQVRMEHMFKTPPRSITHRLVGYLAGHVISRSINPSESLVSCSWAPPPGKRGTTTAGTTTPAIMPIVRSEFTSYDELGRHI